MSIIKKMLRFHEKDDFVMAEYYAHNGCGFTSLLVNIGDCYYDLNNQRFVDASAFTLSRNLSYYLDRDNLLQGKKTLTSRHARKIAKKQNYYKEFFEEWKELNCKDKDVLVESDYSFYAIV